MLLWHPQWSMSCAVCAAYQFDRDGRLTRTPAGEPAPRVPGTRLPCGSCPKPPAWAKKAGRPWPELKALADDMTPANRRAYQHFRACQATGRFPADPIVFWAAGIIGDLDGQFARQQARDATTHLETLVQLGLRRGR